MAIKPYQMKIPPSPKSVYFSIEVFGGLNYTANIQDNETPDCMNIVISETQKPSKRLGYERVFETSLGSGNINGIFEYIKSDGSKELLLAHGTKLYRWQYQQQPVEIYDGLADHEVNTFSAHGKLYILDGTHYLVYDGTSVKSVSENAYIPTIAVSVPPDGGGTLSEQLNRLTPKFRVTFSPDGTKTVFKLPIKNLASDTVIAKLATASGIVEKIEGTDFTVDRVNGTLTFTSAPKYGINTLEVIASRTQDSKEKEAIEKCINAICYGGGNDSRVFMWGSDNNTLYRSELTDIGIDPSYFPINNFQRIGDDNEKIMNCIKQYGSLIVYKERSIHSINYTSEGDKVVFPVKSINAKYGCVSSKTVELLENSPVSLTKNGVYILTQTDVVDERNVEHVSECIDYAYEPNVKGLLQEENLNNAIAVDFDGKYIIAINGYAYLYDYKRKHLDAFGNVQYVWYKWSNINAKCFKVIDNRLYFGDGSGMLFRFKNELDNMPYNDDGQEIDAYWTSKLLSLGKDYLKKNVEKVFVSIRPDTHTSATISFRTDQPGFSNSITTRMDKFNLNNINLFKFSLVTTDISQQTTTKVKLKKIIYIQVKIQNNELDESMSIHSINLKYNYSSEVK